MDLSHYLPIYPCGWFILLAFMKNVTMNLMYKFLFLRHMWRHGIARSYRNSSVHRLRKCHSFPQKFSMLFEVLDFPAVFLWFQLGSWSTSNEPPSRTNYTSIIEEYTSYFYDLVPPLRYPHPSLFFPLVMCIFADRKKTLNTYLLFSKEPENILSLQRPSFHDFSGWIHVACWITFSLGKIRWQMRGQYLL